MNTGVESQGEGCSVIQYSGTVGEPLNTGSSLHARAYHPEPEHFYAACFLHHFICIYVILGRQCISGSDFLLLHMTKCVISLKITAVRLYTPA